MKKARTAWFLLKFYSIAAFAWVMIEIQRQTSWLDNYTEREKSQMVIGGLVVLLLLSLAALAVETLLFIL